MGQNDSASPPFATSGGLPTATDGAGKGAAMPMSRPQPSGPPQLDIDTSQTPAGGPVLFADPVGMDGKSGTMTGVNGEIPFKNLK